LAVLGGPESLGLGTFLLVPFELLEEEGERAQAIARRRRGRRLFAHLAGSSDAILLSEGELGRRQANAIAFSLGGLDDHQDRAETLVFDDRTAGDVGVPCSSNLRSR
jgi:hypothetical protein